MPELPEVEVLVRHLHPCLVGKKIQSVSIRRTRIARPNTPEEIVRALLGAKIESVTRRGKYLLFHVVGDRTGKHGVAVGHLGMTGRMYLLAPNDALPPHAAVVLGLGKTSLVFEDTRYFGRFCLDISTIARLGPEPLENAFTAEYLFEQLRQSRQALKVKLLDQELVAGIGNIYASEALHRAGISPFVRAFRLPLDASKRLRDAIRAVLREAISFGSTVPLNSSDTKTDALFFYGRKSDAGAPVAEVLRVYGRDGLSCCTCGGLIRRAVQAGRSTFYCPRCQPVMRRIR